MTASPTIKTATTTRATTSFLHQVVGNVGAVPFLDVAVGVEAPTAP